MKITIQKIHLLNFDLANNINNGDIGINSLKAAGYCGNENDHTWAIDSPDNDMSFLYTSKFEYQNDIEKLGLSEDLAEPTSLNKAFKISALSYEMYEILQQVQAYQGLPLPYKLNKEIAHILYTIDKPPATI